MSLKGRTMRLKVPSRRPVFDGFPDYYDSEIAPYLRSHERERRKTVKKFFIALAVAATISGAIAVLRPFNEDWNVNGAILVALLGVTGAMAILKLTREDLTRGLLTRICSKFGFAYRRTLSRPDYYSAFSDLKLVPSYDREDWQDEVRGRYRDAEFVVCEAKFEKDASSKTSTRKTVFVGRLATIDYARKFSGETVVRRDGGVFNALLRPGRTFSRVGLASPRFEKIFEVWATDQVEARDLLDPVVLERFLALERRFGGEKLRAAFADGKLLIAVESGNQLGIGSLFRPLENPARVEAILKQFDVIFDLIDIAVGRVDHPLDGALSVDDVRPQGDPA